MNRCFLGLIVALSHPAFALYDFAAINIIPNTDQISFCLDYDTRKIDRTETGYIADNLYIATVTKPAGELLFVEPTTDAFKMTPWPSSGNAPIFSKWRANSEPICLGPFAKPALQNSSIYAGLGNSLQDIMQRNSLIKFFDGFPKLPPSEKTWTIMVYLVGSDLEAKPNRKAGYHWASKDILEMLAGTTLPNTTSNLVISTGGSTRNGWNTVKRAIIQNGQHHVLEDLGPQNMSNPQTLSDFVAWATSQFPAQHHALILWNQGGRTQGYDKETAPSGDSEMMSLNQLHQAYQTIRQHIAKPLDIVVYDTSLMASMEIAQITATVANAMASSVELEPVQGIDYTHLLNNMRISPPENGLAFGRLVKTAYLENRPDTVEPSQITYSVFDLTHLPKLTESFSVFAEAFNKVFKKNKFINYQSLSRALMRTPSYPLIAKGKLESLDTVTGQQAIRIDFYHFLQTIEIEFDELSDSAKTLLKILDQMIVDDTTHDKILEQMIVDYSTHDKIQRPHPNAGRISLDINMNNTAQLSALPKAYRLFNEGLVYHENRRQEDGFLPQGEFVCSDGLTCSCPNWLELEAEDILGIEAYFGQADNSTVYLIDPVFYQYSALTETVELGIDGPQACQYQICVSEHQCEDITVTQQGNQLLADIYLNGSPSILSFCNQDNNGLACRVAPQKEGHWGREERLYFQDNIVPNTLHIQGNETEQRPGKALIISDPNQVKIKKNCDKEKGAIWARYYGLNQRKQIELLCDSGDCICRADDTDPGCQESCFKTGVYIVK